MNEPINEWMNQSTNGSMNKSCQSAALGLFCCHIILGKHERAESVMASWDVGLHGAILLQ